jgi:hypothetical protein
MEPLRKSRNNNVIFAQNCAKDVQQIMCTPLYVVFLPCLDSVCCLVTRNFRLEQERQIGVEFVLECCTAPLSIHLKLVDKLIRK